MCVCVCVCVCLQGAKPLHQGPVGSLQNLQQLLLIRETRNLAALAQVGCTYTHKHTHTHLRHWYPCSFYAPCAIQDSTHVCVRTCVCACVCVCVLCVCTQAMKGLRGGQVFDQWMKHQSDLVQATALSYAEREVMDCCVAAMTDKVPTTGECDVLCSFTHPARARARAHTHTRRCCGATQAHTNTPTHPYVERDAMESCVAAMTDKVPTTGMQHTHTHTRARCKVTLAMSCCMGICGQRYAVEKQDEETCVCVYVCVCVCVCPGAPPSPAVSQVIELCARLYAARCVEQDVGWFISEGVLPASVRAHTHRHTHRHVRDVLQVCGPHNVLIPSLPRRKVFSWLLCVSLCGLARISPHSCAPDCVCVCVPVQAGKDIPTLVRSLVTELSPYSQDIVKSFGIPDRLLAAPIAGDCE